MVILIALRDHTLGGVTAVQPVRWCLDTPEKYRAAAPDLASPGLVQDLELIGVLRAGIAITGDGGTAGGGDTLDTVLVIAGAKCERNDVSYRDRTILILRNEQNISESINFDHVVRVKSQLYVPYAKYTGAIN